jgi:endonuclease-3 related protein
LEECGAGVGGFAAKRLAESCGHGENCGAAAGRADSIFGIFSPEGAQVEGILEVPAAEHRSSLTRMFSTPTEALRKQLLAVHGIGPETADSILLYAGDRAVFVVDAYARRILARHGLAKGTESYEHLRKFFQGNLPLNASLFNEYHALIVHTGKNYCRPKAALCEQCALRPFLPGGTPVGL